MAESPRSEALDTRFSTPVSDLHDHRNQPNSLPPNPYPQHPHPMTRRGTLASIHFAEQERPDLLSAVDALNRHGTITRDFENAIVDDDQSTNGSVNGTIKNGRRSSLAPVSPIERRNTFRRPRQPEDKPNRSRNSSVSSRSVSPPNSVDAFAGPRRRERANTANSVAPSIPELTLHRTISGGTHERRPTFSDNRSVDHQTRVETASRISARSSVEDDVCFPQPEESSKTYFIDFEELEEFVAESQKRTSIDHGFANEFNNNGEPRIFSDLRPGTGTPVPNVLVQTPSETAPNSDSVLNEKLTENQKEILNNTGENRTPTVEKPFNRWTFFSSAQDDMVFASDIAGLLAPGETFRDLFELPEDGGVWWLDMLNPSEEEVNAVCKAFGVHPLTREDIFERESREKVELFKQYYFVCFRSFWQMDKESEEFLEPVNVYIVVFREGLLTFTFALNPHAANVRKRIMRLRDYVNLSADWICYALIDNIVDSFGPVIRDVEDATDSIEDQVFTARAEDSRAILRAIGDCRKRVMSLLRLLGGKADVIKGFAKRCNEQYSVAPRGDVGLYLSDVQDHVVTMMSNLGHFEKMLGRAHSNFLAQVSVDNISSGNKVNENLGKVTVIATILVPLNLITGLFGMNVAVPGKDSNSLAWFFGIVGVILGFVACCLLVAKRCRFI